MSFCFILKQFSWLGPWFEIHIKKKKIKKKKKTSASMSEVGKVGDNFVLSI